MKAFGPVVALLASVSLISCEKEIGPIIDMNPLPVVDSTAPPVDTTYLAPLETATARRVLIEEFTGVKCTNCPAGHNTIKGFLAAYPGRISTIGYQIFNFPQGNPIAGKTHQDNRTQKATDLGSIMFGGVAQMPSAAFDRVPLSNELLLVRPSWAGMLNTRLQTPSPVNLSLTSSYDAGTREVSGQVRVVYTSDVPGKQKLSLALIENKIVDAQEGVDTLYLDYEHEHVFRDFITSTTGDPLLDSLTTKKAGRVFEHRYKYKLATGWKPEECQLIAFVHQADAGKKEILQTAEKAVK